jgi:hypothetical protein
LRASSSSSRTVERPATDRDVAAAAAIAAAAAPADCVRALQAFVGKRQQEVRPPEGFTAQLLRQVETERAALAKTCIGRFPEDQLPAMQLGGLSELYTQAGDPERARAVLTRAMAAPLPPADRSRVLATAINVTLTEPKGDERNARLEKMIDELDAIKDAPFDQMFLAHRRLLGYYRGDDIDAGIIKHARGSPPPRSASRPTSGRSTAATSCRRRSTWPKRSPARRRTTRRWRCCGAEEGMERRSARASRTSRRRSSATRSSAPRRRRSSRRAG